MSDTQHTQIQIESAKVSSAGHFYPPIHPPTRTYPSSHPLTYPSTHSAHPPTDRKHPSQSKPSELTRGFESWLRVRLEFSINALPVLKATDSIWPAAYIGHHSLAKLQTEGPNLRTKLFFNVLCMLHTRMRPARIAPACTGYEQT